MEATVEQREPPAYQRVKDYVLARVHSGEWGDGMVIPTELELASQFGVSRMTVSRALRELSQEKVLARVRGSGTFVTDRKHETTLVRLRSIAEEISDRGGVHRCELHLAERIKADKALAHQFDVKIGDILLHTVIVHFDNDAPIQVEDRFVNAIVAPDYLGIDFRSQTANEYLMKVAPLQRVEFVIESRMPTPTIAEMLEIDPADPCLVLWRKTRSRERTASIVTLWHPGKHYRFSGSF